MVLDGSNDNLLVFDCYNNRAQQFCLESHSTGKTGTVLPDPFEIAMASDGRILVTSVTTNKISLLK